MVKHAHLERKRDLERGIVQIRRRRAVRAERADRHGGREDEGGDVAGERDDGGRDGRGFGRELRDVVRNRSRGQGHGYGNDVVGVFDSREGGDDVRCRDGRVGLDEVRRRDERGGYGGGGVGEGFGRDGIFGAGGVDDAGVEGLQDHGRCDGPETCCIAGSRCCVEYGCGVQVCCCCIALECCYIAKDR